MKEQMRELIMLLKENTMLSKEDIVKRTSITEDLYDEIVMESHSPGKVIVVFEDGGVRSVSHTANLGPLEVEFWEPDTQFPANDLFEMRLSKRKTELKDILVNTEAVHYHPETMVQDVIRDGNLHYDDEPFLVELILSSDEDELDANLEYFREKERSGLISMENYDIVANLAREVMPL